MFCLFLILKSTSSFASSEEENTNEENPLAKSECPQLFGGATTRLKNRSHREKYLHMVQEERSGVTIVHSHKKWKYPILFELKGIVFEGPASKMHKRAKIILSTDLARKHGCSPGKHMISVDDSIGNHGSVLAILKNALLIEYNGKLGYINIKDTLPPKWLVAWKLKGVTLFPGRGKNQGRPSPPKGRPPPTPKRHPPSRRKAPPAPRKR